MPILASFSGLQAIKTLLMNMMLCLTPGKYCTFVMLLMVTNENATLRQVSLNGGKFRGKRQ